MSTGAMKGNQCNEDQSGGGNIHGKGPTKHRLHQPPSFQGKSGQSDNQSTSRGKGRT